MTYKNAKKSYNVCVNIALPNPSRTLSIENKTLAHVAHTAYCGVMACSAPKTSEVLANDPIAATSAPAPSPSNRASTHGMRKPRNSASSPTPAPQLSAKIPSTPSGATAGSTLSSNIFLTSRKYSYLSLCVTANDSDANRGIMYSAAASTLNAATPSMTSGCTSANCVNTCEPTAMPA